MTDIATIPFFRNGNDPGIRWIFLNATKRQSLDPYIGEPTGRGGLTNNDIGALAWQVDNDSFWCLSGISPVPRWVQIGGGAGAGSGDVVGPSGATDNALVRFDLATGKLVQDGIITETDAGVLANTTAGTTGAGNANFALGASVADVNRSVPGGGADNTFDIPIPDDSCVTAEVDSWVLINSKYEHIISEVLCRRISGGNVVYHDTIRNTYTPDPAGGVIDATYHSFAASTTNLRLTRKAHGSQTGIWTTHVRLKSATKPA